MRCFDLNTGEQFADVTNEGRMVEVSVQPADLSVSSEIGPVIEQFETLRCCHSLDGI